MTQPERVVFYAVLAGLCPLIPIPLVDAAVLDQVQRRLVRDVAAGAGVVLSEAQVAVLSGAAAIERTGCIAGCLFGGTWLVVRVLLGLFRKIVVFLLAKDIVDTASRVLHDGVLLDHALRTVGPALQGEDPLQMRARRVRKAMELARDHNDPRPIERTLGRLFRTNAEDVRKAAALLTSHARAAPASPAEGELPEAEEHATLDPLVRRIVAVIWGEGDPFPALRSGFDAQLARIPEDAYAQGLASEVVLSD